MIELCDYQVEPHANAAQTIKSVYADTIIRL
jgi:hypothetical protein